MPDALSAAGLGTTQATVAYRAADSRSRSLYTRASAVLPAGNTRHSLILSPYPVYLTAGAGCRVIDVDGEERIDFLNNLTALIVGHAHPDVVAAVQARVAAGTAFAAPTESEVALAELLAARVPAIDASRFCNSGTEAILLGVKAARAFTGRSRIAKFEGCYHGSYDCAQVSERPTPDRWGPADRPASVPPRGAPAHVADEVLVLPWNDADACEHLIAEAADSLAGLLVDPLALSLGMAEPKPGFLRRLREVTAHHGVVFIADEVLSFRLGFSGACASEGVEPDLVCLGKIIGGGFPVGAVAGRRDIMAVFDHTQPGFLPHNGTYNANPVTMTAGLATMRLMTEEAFARLNALGEALRASVREMLAARSVAAQVCGRGSMFAVRFTDEPLLGYRDLQRHLAAAGPLYDRLCHEMLGRGILTSVRGLFACVSSPMTGMEISAFVGALDDSLAALGLGSGR